MFYYCGDTRYVHVGLQIFSAKNKCDIYLFGQLGLK